LLLSCSLIVHCVVSLAPRPATARRTVPPPRRALLQVLVFDFSKFYLAHGFKSQKYSPPRVLPHAVEVMYLIVFIVFSLNLYFQSVNQSINQSINEVLFQTENVHNNNKSNKKW